MNLNGCGWSIAPRFWAFVQVVGHSGTGAFRQEIRARCRKTTWKNQRSDDSLRSQIFAGRHGIYGKNDRNLFRKFVKNMFAINHPWRYMTVPC